MRIVVAGGTGFLGRHISRALMDDGHQVTVLTRAPDKLSNIPELEGAAGARADVTEPRSLEDALSGAQGVVGAVQFPNYPMELPRKGLTFDRFDRQGTENLLAAARDAGIERYVYVSGAGADPASPQTWYRAKGGAEAAVERSGLAYSILRPSWAYGPEDRALNRFAAISRFSPVVPRLGVRRQRIQPVFVGDIALTVHRIFEEPDAWGRTFEIGGPDVLTMEEIIRTMLDVLGRRRLIVPVPTILAKLGTAPLTLLPTPPMTPGGIEFAVQDGLVDTTDLEKVLGIHPIGLREGLTRYMR